jgi:hypothetical protein
MVIINSCSAGKKGRTPPDTANAVLEQVMAEYFENPPQIEFAADGVGSSQ